MNDIHRKISEIRKRKSYTLMHLAALCGLTKGYLSKIEHGHKVPPVATLQTIAQALGTDFSEFFNEVPQDSVKNPNLDIVRRKERETRSVASSAGYAYQSLVGSLKSKYMAPFLTRIGKGTTDCFKHDSEEFFFVMQGTLDFLYEGKTHTLEQGDSAYFDSRKKHLFRNKGAEDVLLLSVEFNYRRF